MSILHRFLPATTTTMGLCRATERSLCLLQRFNFVTTNIKDVDFIKDKRTVSNSAPKETNWKVIYRLPLIRWASAFNRLKVYQAAATVAGIPGTFVLEKAEILTAGTSTVFGAVGISGIITLALCSLVFKNLIGFVYINQQGNQLKFAYVDYWGRRQDIVVGINDLVPDGARERPTRVNFYQKISLQSNEKIRFKLLQRYGIIVRPEVFNELFY